MRTVHEDTLLSRYDFHETLFAATSFGLPQVFNIEWLIDKAERGEWGGLWW